MTVTRVPTINELFSVSLQGSQGVAATPVTADIMTYLNCDLNPDIENILRADKGLGRSMFGYVAPGKQTAKWTAALYAILANAGTPPVAPPFEELLVGAMGNAAVVLNDTVQASPAPTASAFAVSSAASLKVGDPIAVNVGGATGWQMRPISAIAANTLTFSPPFSAAPTVGNVVQSRIYRLSATINYLTIVDWLRDSALAVSNLARMAVDAVVDSFVLDCTQSVVQLTCGGPAAYVNEKQTPNPPSAFPSLPGLPVNLTTAFSPETPYLNGEFFLDTTLVTAYTVKMALSNSAKQLPVPFGSTFADGTALGQRKVSLDLTVDGNSGNYAYLLDAEQKNPHALFFHTGQTQGQFIGVFSPKMVLGLNDIEKNDVTVRLNFANSLQFATSADNELVIGIS